MHGSLVIGRTADQKRYGIKSSYRCKNEQKIQVRPYSAIVMAI